MTILQAVDRRRVSPAEPERSRHAGLRGRCSTGVGWWGVGVGIVLALGAGGCAKARAETVPDGPPLQMPAPPQRVLAPVEAVAVPAVAAEPDALPEVAAPPTPPATGPRDLRAASPTNARTEPGVREMLASAARDIGAVNYNRLSAEGRAQYAQSVRFSAQAEQALAGRNLIFAATLAEKAATLAAELLGR